jgi:saccharopine dehydrogenase-like NADP-dependent oxidoreductase
MGKHVIVGAGQVGRHLAELLSAQGQEVTVVSRSAPAPRTSPGSLRTPPTETGSSR